MIIEQYITNKLRELSESSYKVDSHETQIDICIAKCHSGKWDEVSEWLLKLKPLTLVGTDINFPLYRRMGDYDFSLIGIILIAKLWRNNLSPECRKHIFKKLLVLKGGNIRKKKFGPFGLLPETENHRLLSNGSLYLTNEIIFEDYDQSDVYNNLKNGVHEHLKNHLIEIKNNGLYEYNSRPYNELSLRALLVINSLTINEEIKSISKEILDGLFLKYAVQSWRGYLVVPFRRKNENAVDEIRDRDVISSWGAAYTNFSAIEYIENLTLLLFSRVLEYRPPQEYIKYLLDDYGTYWSRAKYSNLEITYREKNFALFSGGYTDKPFFINTGENATVRPTCLMTRDGSTKLSELIRFEPNHWLLDNNNTGIYKNFACGMNIKIPPNVKSAYNAGEFSFYEFPGCYAAVRMKNNYGCLEVVDSSEFVEFQDFCRTVLQNNHNTSLKKKDGTYMTTRGDLISFNCLDEPKNWLIISVKNVISGDSIDGKSFNQWPLLQYEMKHKI